MDDTLLPIMRAETSLTVILGDTAKALREAKTSAQILDARRKAKNVYRQAKAAQAQLVKERGAHDEIVRTARKMQGDALILEEQANAILAAHYEEAQERGEVAKPGQRGKAIPDENSIPRQPDLGIDPKVTMRGRLLNAAEEFEPGIMQRVVQEMIDEGLEPTRAKLQAAVEEAAARALSGRDVPRSPRRKVEPTALDGVMQIGGAATEILEQFETWSLHALARSFVNDGMRSDHLKRYAKCVKLLSRLIEEAEK
jgi:hypothetical protein